MPNESSMYGKLTYSKRGLELPTRAAIGHGLFPLSSSKAHESVMQQWYRYTQAIQDAIQLSGFYATQPQMNSNAGIEILARSFEGLMATKLAVNIVPSSYSLPEICEIFEVLNTTGTKVSTVDLIHSWLFSETVRGKTPPSSCETG